MLTAESVSVPFRNPMFDVQDVFRFYRCPITDVHIGRSLNFSEFIKKSLTFVYQIFTYDTVVLLLPFLPCNAYKVKLQKCELYNL